MNNKQILGWIFLSTGILLMLTKTHNVAIIFNGIASGIFLSDLIDKFKRR